MFCVEELHEDVIYSSVSSVYFAVRKCKYRFFSSASHEV